jgi:hypothetical protein
MYIVIGESPRQSLGTHLQHLIYLRSEQEEGGIPGVGVKSIEIRRNIESEGIPLVLY